MKTKKIIKTAREIAKPFRITKGKDFRLKDVNPNDTLDFTRRKTSFAESQGWTATIVEGEFGMRAIFQKPWIAPDIISQS